MSDNKKHYVARTDVSERKKIRIGDLNYLNKEWYNKSVYAWNETEKAYPCHKTIPVLFEEQASRTPDRMAVVSSAASLTYKELNERSNQLAHYLRQVYNIRPDDLVGLFLDRSEHILISILGVLKSGGAYVPMDTRLPKDRLGYVVKDIAAKVVLANEQYADKLRSVTNGMATAVESIDSDDLQARISITCDAMDPAAGSGPEDLAYVIYTSGTTGWPKGVMVEHRSVVNYLFNVADVLPEGIERVDLSSNLSFDLSVTTTLYPLCFGKCIFVYDKDSADVVAYEKHLINNKVDLIKSTPSYLASIGELQGVVPPKVAIVGGEKLTRNQLNKLLDISGIIIDEYGPTETTVGATCYRIDRDMDQLSIGKAYKNCKLYVVNANCAPVPIGAVGELYIGGAGVARGYLNQAELTAERFIANPFQTEEERERGVNGRLYRTGDLVRYRSDGSLEYIGRNDQQVKIRGYRVELEEIESRMLGYPGVRQSAAVLRQHGTGAGYLAGYYVSGGVIGEAELQSWLGEVLPEYMVPSVLVRLERLPLTPNGKLDRGALPEPGWKKEDSSYTAPGDELERALCGIYSEVLGLEESQVGINDDFFRLGGDSIVSIQLVSRIRRRLGVEVSVGDIFTYRTISSLSREVLRRPVGSTEKRLSEEGRLEGAVGLLPIQAWFFAKVEQGVYQEYDHYNQSFLIHVPRLDRELLRLSVEKLSEYHDVLRMGYEGREGDYRQYYRKEVERMEVRYAQTGELGPEGLGRLLTEWQSNFSVLGGRLWSAGYVEGYVDGSARVWLGFHHLVMDAVSWRIVTEDLERLYKELVGMAPEERAGMEAEKVLGRKGTSYRQWVEAVRGYAGEGDEGGYWKQKEDRIAAGNGVLRSLAVEEVSESVLVLDRDRTGKLLRESGKVYGAQINDLLLSGLGRALEAETGMLGHGVVLEGHGRERLREEVELSHTVGWFTTLYPVWVSTGGGEPGSWVVSVKEELRGVPGNGIGYGSLMGYEGAGMPVISFNYLGQFTAGEGTGEGNWFLAGENAGRSRAARNRSPYLLALDGAVIGDQLQFHLSGRLSPERVESLSAGYLRALEELVDALGSVGRTYLTVSDIGGIIGRDYLDRLQSEREVEGVYLANSLQEGFIYHALHQGEEDDAYRVQTRWEYSGRVEVERMREAWRNAQRRYPSLRMRFGWEEELVQVIDKEGEVDWRYRDIGELSEEEQEKFIGELWRADRGEVYDLSAGRLLRVYLIRLGEERYSCIVSHHHAILDGWSGPILLEYVHGSYGRLVRGEEERVEVDGSYGEAQRYLQDHREDNRGYWEEYVGRLESREDLSSLLKTGSREVVLSDYRHIVEPREVSMTIGGWRYGELKELCMREGITVNAMMQYCWHRQLSVYGNSETTVVGMTVAGRNLPVEGIEESVGLYINTLPVIVEHGDGKVVEEIRKLQERINEINSRSDMSLGRLQQQGGGRLFSSLFVYENYPIPESVADKSGNALGITIGEVKERTDYPLEMIVSDRGEGIILKLLYAGELFEEEMMRRMLDGVELILDQLIADHTIRIKGLRHVNDVAYRHIIYDWKTGGREYATDKPLQVLFEEQVLRRPDGVAVVYEGVEWSYRELNERSNQLAHYLREVHGIGRDELVGLCLDRGEQMLIAILGVLKSGGAYVPMDPGYPADRIGYMIEDTGMRVMLTQREHAGGMRASATDRELTVVVMDEPELLWGGYSGSNPAAGSGPGDLAYVIYTSGTTGRPKGVMVEHRNVVRLFGATDEWYGFNERDVWVLFHSYVFDFSVWEIWGALLYGGSLLIPTYEQTRDASLFFEWCMEKGVSVLNQTPSAFYGLMGIAVQRVELLSNLRYIIFGGEALNLRQLKPWYGKYGQEGPKLVNMYGITETTVHVTYKEIQANDLESGSLIGKALPDLQEYILDGELRVLPIGAIGELYIGGAGVARGYLNQAELTAERFIANSFQTVEEKVRSVNGRLYRTGDLVRYLPDGSLEYIGRNDLQVKIRGYRIELGEIESRLSAYPGVRQTVVLVRQQSPGVNYLVGYYVSGEALDQEDILSWLRGVLPEHMIPSALVRLDGLPLTVNGKLDRDALPDPQFMDETRYVAPANESEAAMCRIFGEVLGLDGMKIGVEDDFFRLGGDSILAIRLVSKIAEVFQCEVKVRDIFVSKRIRPICEMLLRQGKDWQQELYKPFSLVDLAMNGTSAIAGVSDMYPASYLQAGMLLESERTKGVYHNILCYRIEQAYDHERFARIFNRLVDKHELLRAKFLLSDEGYTCVIQDRIDMDIKVVHGEDPNRLIEQERARGFDPGKAGLFRVVINSGGEGFDLNFTSHHAIEDGWSIASLSNEFTAAYTRGDEIAAAPSLHYGEFVARELQVVKDPSAAAFWKQYLSDVVRSDVRWKESEETSGSGLVVSTIVCEDERSKKIHRLAQAMQVSVDSLFLYIYLNTLARFLDQEDIVVGVTVNNRLEKDGGDLLFGLFLNTMPFRYHTGRDQVEGIPGVFRKKVELYTYKAFPYGKIKAMFGYELYQFAFNFVHFHVLESYSNASATYSYNKTNIPFILDVSQYGQNRFHLSFHAQEEVASQDRLDHFMKYYDRHLEDLLSAEANFASLIDEDRQRLTHDWSSMGKGYTMDGTLCSRFEEQVLRTPDRVAVVYEGVEWSYRELNERSNQLAHYLREVHGIGRDELVGLCLDRSEQMLIAILGVLKSGGAYVPMDPGYPAERIGYMMEDTGMRVLLTQQEHAGGMRASATGKELTVVVMDGPELLWEGYSGRNPAAGSGPGDLAYVIYTSGTTGRPKGVMVEHRGVVNLIGDLSTRIGLGNDEVVLQLANYVFDASVEQIFLAILGGHKLVLIPNRLWENEPAFIHTLTSHGVTYIDGTPSLLAQLPLGSIASLRYLNSGGERLTETLLKRLKRDAYRLINCYGPTEATITAVVTADAQMNEIGRPIANTAVYVLDGRKLPAPLGAPGELYIGGAGVARGYLNQAELTAERFIANPFQTEEERERGVNGRLYRTGDLVRYRSDGSLEYIGRNDQQVKIRGYRVELEEIESRMLGYPGVRQSAAVLRQHGTGAGYLAGYYVSGGVIGEAELQSWLGEVLPEYMVPSVLVRLERLPLTPNGKLDRGALPEPVLTAGSGYVAPGDELERALCGIYSEVLGLEESQVGINDDFFRLGGDSIVSIQLVSRIRRRLGVEVSVGDIFTYRTISSLSREVLRRPVGSTEKRLSEEGRLEGAVGLLPIQAWFFAKVEQGVYQEYDHYNQSFLIHVPRLDRELLRLSVEKLSEYHDVLRMGYEGREGDYRQYYRKEVERMEVRYAQTGELGPEGLGRLLTEWQSNFSVLGGRLWSAGYVEGYVDGSARVWLGFHHLVMDAVSWRIVTEDLERLYKELVGMAPEERAGMEAEKVLGRKGTSYRQWVEAVRGYAGEGDEGGYWKQKEDRIAAGNGVLRSLAVEEVSESVLVLDRDRTGKLLRESGKVYGAQINDLLLSGLGRALEAETGMLGHGVVLEGHGRERLREEVELSHTVGWFTTLYPVWVSTGGGEPGSWVVSVKEELRGVPGNGIGYGSLMGYEGAGMPVISFNYLGQFTAGESGSREGWFITAEGSGKPFSLLNREDHTLIDINGAVIEGELRFRITGRLSPERVESLSAGYLRALEELVDALGSVGRTYLTVSDIGGIIGRDYLDRLQSEREVEGVYLANSLQEGFIYHALHQGEEDDAYRVQTRWEYSGRVEVERMREAWRNAQRRYPSLRMRFGWEEELVQVIDKEGEVDWRYRDIGELSEEEQEKFIGELWRADRGEVYDLSAGRLLRVYLIRLGEERYSCIVSHHHAILDGWSGPILLEYVHGSYGRLVRGEEERVEVDGSYGEAQRYLQDHREDNRGYWEEYVGRLESREDLSSLLKTGRREVVLSDYRHIMEPWELPMRIRGERYQQLKELCVREGITVNAVLQYCWHCQLSVYGNSKTTVVGMTVAGRNLPVEGIEESVGLYINTLPVIVEHGDGKVVEEIRKLQERINEINSRSDMSLGRLQQQGGGRLFSSLFAFENYPKPKELAVGVENELQITMQQSEEKTDYPLSVTAYDQGDMIVFGVKYAAELFDAEIVTQFAAGGGRIVDDLVKNNHIRTTELNFLSGPAYQRIVYDLNATQKEYATDRTTSALFEEQVLRTPDVVAVVNEGVELSYRELNERSNQLAHYLREVHGVGRDELVGLCLDRSEQMLIAILGVLKSGGAYVPVDPHYPVDRIEYILKDTGARAVLTNVHHEDRLQAIAGKADISLVSVDSDELQARLSFTCDGANPITDVGVNDLAYVIYTSGTTGRPKGVMVEHRSVVNYLFNVADVLPEGIERVDFSSSLSFDLSVTTTLYPLCFGKTIYVYGKSLTDVTAYERHLIANKIDLVKSTPGFLSLLNGGMDSKLRIKTAIVGGEKLLKGQSEKILQFSGNIIDEYGPTEATVGATYYRIDKETVELCIGKAYNNCRVYVLNDHLAPVPVGELYIGGAGVARGYLHLPQLTKERFIVRTFLTEEKESGVSERLYRTGDIVRLRPDGSLEYIGRNDQQVKIRGYRIELGEIESMLSTYPFIKQSAVAALEQSPGVRALVAYYVSAEDLEEEALLSWLRERLPEHILPSRLIRLDKLPLTANGKLDRKALPDPASKGMGGYVPPADETENALCGIYADVLGLDRWKISVEEDFFRLGGDSISAVRTVNRINKLMGTQIQIMAIFTHRTIRRLSRQLLEGEQGEVRIVAHPVDDPVQQVLSFAQERLWFMSTYEGNSDPYNVPLVFRILESVNVESFLSAIRFVVNRHEVLRTLIRTSIDGVGYQQVMNDRENPLKIDRGSVFSEPELRKAINVSVHHSFQLDREYPIMVTLYDLVGEHGVTSYLSIVLHHIAFDGWSMDILQREVLTHYAHCEALRRGDDEKAREYELPALDLQYKEYALWQRGFMSGPVLTKQLDHWRAKLSGYEPLHLPVDTTRPVRVNYEGMDIYFSLEEEMSHDLREVARELEVSLFSVLLSGYYLLLGIYSGQKDIVVGTPVANRHYREVENMIGFFVNTLALREKIAPDQDLRGFIRQVGRSVMEAQLHQDLPFELLVEELGVEQDTSRHPIFQVMFGLEGVRRDSGEAVDKLVEPFENDGYRVARFDLAMMITESAGDISGVMTYSTCLFKEETISEYVIVYREILRQIGNTKQSKNNPRIGGLRYLSEEGLKQVVYGWNATKRAYPADKTIAVQFEKQAERTPDRVALSYKGERVSYRELNERTNQLAHYLDSVYGIEPDQLIGLYMDPSEHMVIAMLGVLKSGGAYVPIDPAYPEERIKFILDDTGTRLVLTNAVYTRRLEKTVEGLPVAIEALDDAILQTKLHCFGTSGFTPLTTGRNLAYVIYTSGTTGRPKGVMVEQSSVLNMALAPRYKLAPEDGGDPGIGKNCLVYANYVFDAQVWEIFAPLSGGHTLFIIDRDTRTDISALNEYILQNRIQVANIPPVLLDKDRILPLETLVVAGETTSLQVIHAYLSAGVAVINGYGPTEATVVATMHDFGEESNNRNIGRPLSNVTVYVLDSSLTPVPVGAVGELYIGGAGVARGYLNRPALTAERFIANPFQLEVEKQAGVNGRLYRTGDLARYLPGGDLEYIGRCDFQVKVRGHRIEPGEIESVLLSYPGVKQSVVSVRKHPARGNSLVGYYMAEGRLDEDDLRAYLSVRLPEFMMPAALVHIEKMPLTGNGKLDQQALPDAEFIPVIRYVSAENEGEAALCRIYGEVLGLDAARIGVEDDFFRLGGDSIISIQLVSRIRRQLKLPVDVKDIFIHRTVRKLNKALANRFPGMGVERVSEQGLLEGEVGLLPIQSWFFDKVNRQLYGAPDQFIQSFVMIVPRLEKEWLEESLRKLAAYHDVLRIGYERVEGGYRQYFRQAPGEVSLNYADIKGLQESGIIELLTRWQSEIKVFGSKLWVAGYLETNDNERAGIYFAFHHLIIDTVSWRIIRDDLRLIYEGVKTARQQSEVSEPFQAEDHLGLKGTSYRQWVKAISEYPNTYPDELEYWNGVMADYRKAGPAFGEGMENEAIDNFENLILDEKTTHALLTMCSRAYNAEINDLLLAALGVVLCEVTGNDRNYILLEGHGRESFGAGLDVSGTVGWFTTIFPVRLSVIMGHIGHTIEKVQENLRAIPNKGVGFGAIRGYLSAELPRIAFNYLGQFDQDNKSEAERTGMADALSATDDWRIIDAPGQTGNAGNRETNILSINCFVSGGQLRFSIQSKLDPARTSKIGSLLIRALTETVDHCVPGNQTDFAPDAFEEGFAPYVILNDDVHSPAGSIFMLPPGDAGVETYINNVIARLPGKRSVAFNSYYGHIEKILTKTELNAISFEFLASYYARLIRQLQPEGHYTLFGWSFGGVLSYEIARQLTASGGRVEKLVMIDSLFEVPEGFGINSRYRPGKAGRVAKSTVLFKAAEVPKSMGSSAGNQGLFSYYVSTKDNHFSRVSGVHDFEIVAMESDHFSWMHNREVVSEICKKLG